MMESAPRGLIKSATLLLAFFSPFLFPLPMTLFLGAAAALFVPAFAFFLGVLVDALFYTSGVPWGVVFGISGAVVAHVVRSFVGGRVLFSNA